MITLSITSMGSRWWHCNDRLHRIIGPSFNRSYGSYAWYNHGKRHRLGGPACIWATGQVEYWINGNQVTEYEHMFLTRDPL